MLGFEAEGCPHDVTRIVLAEGEVVEHGCDVAVFKTTAYLLKGDGAAVARGVIGLGVGLWIALRDDFEKGFHWREVALNVNTLFFF